MKIAMVSEHASPLAALGGVDAGGQNIHVASLASALADRGHEVSVYTRRDSSDLPDRVGMSRGVEVVHLDAGPATTVPKDELLPFIPDLREDLAARLADSPPDVIHAHFWMSGLAAVGAATAVRRPVVQTFHALGTVKRRFQGAADTSPSERISLERDVCVHADRIIASCRDELRELAGIGARPESVDVIPSGVDLTTFGRSAQPEQGARADRRRRLAVVGRLVPRKGVDDAIRAVALLPKDVDLLVVGGPGRDGLEADDEYRRLRELADSLDIADRVQFLGRVPNAELPALLRSCLAVLCLPWYEPFGIVPLEAMACSVPVVGSAVGGLLDTVQDGRTGLLVPPHAPEQAAAAVMRLLDRPGRRRRMGAAAHRRACRYTWPAVARATEQTYRHAIATDQLREYEEAVS